MTAAKQGVNETEIESEELNDPSNPKLYDAIHNSHLTIEQICRRSGISRNALRNWWLRNTEPKGAYRNALMSVLDRTETELGLLPEGFQPEFDEINLELFSNANAPHLINAEKWAEFLIYASNQRSCNQDNIKEILGLLEDVITLCDDYGFGGS